MKRRLARLAITLAVAIGETVAFVMFAIPERRRTRFARVTAGQDER